MMETPNVTGKANGATKAWLQASPDRDLNAEEKRNVRRLLDEYFDDQRGEYLEGWSDRKIAETLGYPTARVVEIRKTSYGELRVDSEATKIRKELEALPNQIEVAGTSFLAEVERAKRQFSDCVDAKKREIEAARSACFEEIEAAKKRSTSKHQELAKQVAELKKRLEALTASSKA
jgi:gas vesicle protein